MKKFLLSLGLIGMLGGFVSITSANTTNCKTVNFSNGVTACVNIQKVSGSRRNLTTTVNGATNSNIRCDFMTPDSTMRPIPGCNSEFTYNGTTIGRTKLWIRYVISYQNELAPSSRDGKPNSNSERTYPQWVYNFNNAERADNTLNNNSNNNNTSNGDLNNFYVSTDDTTPSTSQYIDLTVKARDNSNYTLTDYNDTVKFKVYYRSSSSSSWIQTTSSTYYTMASNYNSYGYDFTSSNNGIKTFTNFIKFNKNNYDYKVRVYDENNTSIYNEITFYVGSSNSSSNVNGFSSSELNTVQQIYNGRDEMITNLEDTYSILRNSTSRQTRSNNFKSAMQEIINNYSNKQYNNYDAFYSAWVDWYRYTISIR